MDSNCRNCGANTSTNGKCDYCKTTICEVHISNKFDYRDNFFSVSGSTYIYASGVCGKKLPKVYKNHIEKFEYPLSYDNKIVRFFKNLFRKIKRLWL